MSHHTSFLEEKSNNIGVPERRGSMKSCAAIEFVAIDVRILERAEELSNTVDISCSTCTI
jgi:hypothetical protein